MHRRAKPFLKRVHSLEIPDLVYEGRGSSRDEEDAPNVANTNLFEADNFGNDGFSHAELDELLAGYDLLDTPLTNPATLSAPQKRVSGSPAVRQRKGRVSRKQKIQGP